MWIDSQERNGLDVFNMFWLQYRDEVRNVIIWGMPYSIHEFNSMLSIVQLFIYTLTHTHYSNDPTLSNTPIPIQNPLFPTNICHSLNSSSLLIYYSKSKFSTTIYCLYCLLSLFFFIQKAFYIYIILGIHFRFWIVFFVDIRKKKKKPN